MEQVFCLYRCVNLDQTYSLNICCARLPNQE